MKLLVSDYDGTLYNVDNLFQVKRNVESINEFMKDGNMFAIATGRSFKSIHKQTVRFQIPYNYLICDNGSSVFDSNNELIYFKPINEETLRKTLEYLRSIKSVRSIQLYDAYGNITSDFKSVSNVTISLTSISDYLRIKDEINYLVSACMFNVMVIKEFTDKSDGISFISQRENIHAKDIYTVGDELNDLNMILMYNGYRVRFSNPKLIKRNIETTSSVKSLIRKIERK